MALAAAGRVLLAWASHRDSLPAADDIVLRTSEDDGAHFGPEVVLNSDHLDPHSTYHGFLALASTPRGEAALAWIDGRATLLAPGEDEPAHGQIRMVVSRDGGASWSPDALVASDVCSCCRVSLQLDDAGRIAVAYRGARDDLRDPRLALSLDHGVSFGTDTLVALDHWRLRACPSIGPSVALAGDGGLYAWSTGSDSTADHAPPGSYFARWRLNGEPSARRPLSDSLRTAERPMLAASGQSIILGVLAVPAEDTTRHVLAVRRFDPRGEPGPWLFLGAGVHSAAIATDGPGSLWAAWIERLAGSGRLRLARVVTTP